MRTKETERLYKYIFTGANFSSASGVQDRNGRTLTKISDQLQRWAEHLYTILNREEPRETWPANRGDRQQLQNKHNREITRPETEETTGQT